MKTPLIVRLWGMEVGRLNWDFKRRTCYFQFNQDFLKTGLNPFPLVAPIEFQTIWTTHFGEEERMYKHLPSFIADSLPDAWGTQLLELWRKEQHLAANEVGPLESLAFVGKRAMGALEYEPALQSIPMQEKVDVRALALLANKIMNDREKLRIEPDEAITMQLLMQVGTSAGGMRPKAILAINPETGEITSGQIADQEGFDYYILKFGDPVRQTAELEMVYYKMALDSGIDMSECRLWEVDGIQHFLTKRFDRQNGDKIHLQTIAAMMPEANSYEQLLYVCRRLQLPQSAIDEMFRRMVFNILANNTDDHKKNFSFMMNRAGEWSITPAYDLTYIFDMGGHTPLRDHCFTTCGKTRDTTIEEILEFAKENNVRNPEGIIRQVAKAIEAFPQRAEEMGVRQEWVNHIWPTLEENLHAWHLYARPGESPYRIEQAYKGNYHLFVRQEDGRERRYVIRPKMAEYAEITERGIHAITDERFAEWIAGWGK